MAQTTGVTLFATENAVLFSVLAEKKMGLTVDWKQWRPKIIELRDDGFLAVRDSLPQNQNWDIYNILTVTVTHMNQNAGVGSGNGKEGGILLDLRTADGRPTRVRFILDQRQQDDFYRTLRLVAKQHNLDSIRQLSITEHVHSAAQTSSANPFANIRTGRGSISTMRSTIAMAMDKVDSRTQRERIIQKRGALRFLPVLFANDMVHGAWWYAIASVLFIISSGLVLDNSWKHYLGDDDSFLTVYRYRSTWVLMVISGIFFTLGSLVFVRAVHEDPPMAPLFTWYHVQNDELLGSWLFFFATLPVIPYALIYLAASHEAMVYVVALVVSVIFVFITYLFVRACYPTEQPRIAIVRPLVYGMFCLFCPRSWLKKHLANDWLAGCWLFFFGMLLATVLCIMLLIYELTEGTELQTFIIATSLVETICCVFGSAYWVAGSYPEHHGSAQPSVDNTTLTTIDDDNDQYEDDGRRFLSPQYFTSHATHASGDSTSNSTSRPRSIFRWIFSGSVSSSPSASMRGKSAGTENTFSTPFISSADRDF